jgi:protein-S-isoprenylcysteine O-methyltransferase Ste14
MLGLAAVFAALFLLAMLLLSKVARAGENRTLTSMFEKYGPAVATSDSATAHVAAIASTWLPFALPLLHAAPPGPVRQAVADVLLVCGMAWSVWSLRSLGRNVSVLAQARDIADKGPYRWVRHPLYTGEIVSALGVAIAMNSRTALAFPLVLCALQVYRALREEEVLLKALPAYRSYRQGTAALLPGVFWRRANGLPGVQDCADPVDHSGEQWLGRREVEPE